VWRGNRRGGGGGGKTIKLAKNCRWPVPAYLHVLRTHVNNMYLYFRMDEDN